MNFRVSLFAGHRDIAGADFIDVSLPAGSRASDLVAAVKASCPKLANLLPSARVAINEEYCAPDALLVEGDEVAIIPPVSGG